MQEAEERAKSRVRRDKEAVVETDLHVMVLLAQWSPFSLATPDSCKRSFHMGKPCILSVSEQTQSYCYLFCKNHGSGDLRSNESKL